MCQRILYFFLIDREIRMVLLLSALLAYRIFLQYDIYPVYMDRD